VLVLVRVEGRRGGRGSHGAAARHWVAVGSGQWHLRIAGGWGGRVGED